MSEKNLTPTYYDLLNLKPSASVQQIRRSYRELSKLYHPDTTTLPAAIATAKFQEINEAYATLSSPERRLTYDLKIGYSRVSVIQAPSYLNRPASEARKYKSSAYLDPTDRPLSAGEIFALFLLGLTFVACLLLVFAVGVTRGEMVFQPLSAFRHSTTPIEVVESQPTEPLSDMVIADGNPDVESARPDLQPDVSTVAPAPSMPTPERESLFQRSTLLQLIKEKPGIFTN